MTHGYNICQQGYNICLDNINTLQPVAIPSATMAITSASPQSGYSICHNKHTISCHICDLFHLLHWAITSAHSCVVIPSATLAITSANSHCGYNTCHIKQVSNVVPSSTYKYGGTYICYNGNNISHYIIYGKQHLPKIPLVSKNVTTTSVTSNIQEVGPKNIQKLYYIDIHVNFWQKITTKIV